MVLPAVKEQILKDLDHLSPEEQKRAAHLVHELISPLPKGTPGKDLLRFSGILDKESADEMMAAVEEAFEQVDPNEW